MLVVLLQVLIAVEGYAQNVERPQPRIEIIFNDSAAAYVLQHPAEALANQRDSIWRTFGGYQIALIWHRESSIPVTWDIWEKGLRKFLCKDTSLIRKSQRLAADLRSKVQGERDKIARYIASYTGGQSTLNAYVYLVAFTTAYAFCVEKNKIGIDITADEWSDNTDCVLNMLVHEIYHVAFNANSPDNKYREGDPVDGATFLRFHLAYLQSEGMATYAAYKALSLFPTTFRHSDYDLLEDESRVRKAISQVNELTVMSRCTPADSLNKEAWNIGVSERAYYVAGSYMAREIEQHFGTPYLAQLVQKGSLEFVKAYNTFAIGSKKITLEGLPRP